jgi:hypothetical protein
MAASRSRAFCRALSEETGGRLLRWATIDSVADRLGIDHEEAAALAAELDAAGLVRVGGGHSVILEEAGRQLAKDAARAHLLFECDATFVRRQWHADLAGNEDPGAGPRIDAQCLAKGWRDRTR